MARTYGYNGSNEVTVAKKIANRLGMTHYIHEPKDINLSSFLYSSVWRTECRVHFTGLKSIVEHNNLKNKFLYNINGHFGDVLTGKQLRPFMFYPQSKDSFLKKIFNHYISYTFKNPNILKILFNKDYFNHYYPQVQDKFINSFRSIDATNNWDLYDTWDLTNRQPRFTFSSCAVDNYIFQKMAIFTDYDYVDFMLKIPGRLRFGQGFYKKMIADSFPRFADIENANSGKKISNSYFMNLVNLAAQYKQSKYNRKTETCSTSGKAHLIRKDSLLKDILITFTKKDSFPSHIFSRKGINQITSYHYNKNQDCSYLLGVLATFIAANDMFIENIHKTIPEKAIPFN